MADVFVSYARRDQPLAEQLAQGLTKAGFTVWWDTNLLPHNRFANVIEEEIGAARAVLVIWSEAAVASQWVRSEAEFGRSKGKLIQVAIDGCTLPMPFNQFQTADLRTWKGDPANPEWRKVLASVGHFTGDPSSEAPFIAPSPPPDRPPAKWTLPVNRTTLKIAGGGALAVIAAASALLWSFSPHESRGARIAVQPFTAIGSAPALGDFAAEVSDALQSVLTQDQLQTLSPGEAQELKGDDLAGRAKKLGVGLMFDGTVQSKGPGIDVRMRIDDPVQRTTLWTAEMSGAQSDQLQARVGALTVAVLNCSQQVLAPWPGTHRCSAPGVSSCLRALSDGESWFCWWKRRLCHARCDATGRSAGT